MASRFDQKKEGWHFIVLDKKKHRKYGSFEAFLQDFVGWHPSTMFDVIFYV